MLISRQEITDLSRGICRLCKKYRELRQSHFVPRGFYPKDLRRLQYATQSTGGIQRRHVKQHLLCGECEEKFNKNGENYAIGLIRPNRGAFPLRDKIASSTSQESDGIYVASGLSMGIDTGKLAYFMLSLVWRASITRWRLPDRSLSTLLELGCQQEPIRKLLNGDTDELPDGVAIIILVGTDQYSRDRWFIPTAASEGGVNTVQMLMRGVFFRLLMGDSATNDFGSYCCVKSPTKCLFMADLEKRVSMTLADMPFKEDDPRSHSG